MIGLLLISLAFFLLIFILNKGKLVMIFLSLIISGLALLSGYYWFLYGLRVKENSKVYFIENRYGEYQSYLENELQRELEIESKKVNDNKVKMNVSAIIFILCIGGLATETAMILKLPNKFSRIHESS